MHILCVYIYIHTHTHTYIHTHDHTRSVCNIEECIYIYIYIYIYTYIYIWRRSKAASLYIYIYIHTYIYIYTTTHADSHFCMHMHQISSQASRVSSRKKWGIYIYIYIYTPTHTDTHFYMYMHQISSHASRVSSRKKWGAEKGFDPCINGSPCTIRNIFLREEICSSQNTPCSTRIHVYTCQKMTITAPTKPYIRIKKSHNLDHMQFKRAFRMILTWICHHCVAKRRDGSRSAIRNAGTQFLWRWRTCVRNSALWWHVYKCIVLFEALCGGSDQVACACVLSKDVNKVLLSSAWGICRATYCLLATLLLKCKDAGHRKRTMLWQTTRSTHG